MAKTINCWPESRRAPSQVANSSEDRDSPRLSSSTSHRRGTRPMPGYKSEQCLLITESSRFHVGIGCNAIEIHRCCGAEQVAPVTLGDEGECEVQTGYGMSPLRSRKSRF